MNTSPSKCFSENRKSAIENLKWPALLVIAFVLLVCGAVAEAQQPAKVARIGFLASFGSGPDTRIKAFQQGLRELGYIEGKNIVIEYRYAEGSNDRLTNFAADFVRVKVDVIVTGSTIAVRAAKKLAETIPVVMAGTGDPVGTGLVASLSRPGGNVTGLSSVGPELNTKRLELLKETVTGVSRIAVLFNGANPSNVAALKQVEIAARALGVQIQSSDVRGADDYETAFDAAIRRRANAEAAAKGLRLRLQFLGAKGADDLDSAFDAAKRAGAQAIIAHPSTFLVTNRARIIDLAAKNRLPAIYPSTRFAEAGGLMSYGPDAVDNSRRAAVYVDKILKRTKPADLPVQQPMKFELVINLKAAKQIGLTIPPNVLVRADRVFR